MRGRRGRSQEFAAHEPGNLRAIAAQHFQHVARGNVEHDHTPGSRRAGIIHEPDRDAVGGIRRVAIAQDDRLVGLGLVNLEPGPGLQVEEADADLPAGERPHADIVAAILRDVHRSEAAGRSRRFVGQGRARDDGEFAFRVDTVKRVLALVVHHQPPIAWRERRRVTAWRLSEHPKREQQPNHQGHPQQDGSCIL